MAESFRRAGGTPPGVAARLDQLRALHTAESEAEARRRLAAEQPRGPEPFPAAVARRLAELRALEDLAAYLHRRRSGGA